MKRPREAVGSAYSTQNYKGDDGGLLAVDRQIEAAIDRIVRDNQTRNYRDDDQVLKAGSDAEAGLPPHEWSTRRW